MNKLLKAIPSISLLLFLSISCGKNDAKPARDNNGNLIVAPLPKKVQAELQARREKLQAMIRDKYDLGETRSSRDQLVRDFIVALIKGDEQTARSLVMNDREYGEIFWPNQPDRFTMNYGMPPKTAVSWARMKRNMGIQSLGRQLRGRKVVIKRIVWKKKTRSMNALEGHDLKFAEVTIDGRKENIREIRIVVKHQGRWKIAVVNTD